jgi:hypothetical protein
MLHSQVFQAKDKRRPKELAKPYSIRMVQTRPKGYLCASMARMSRCQFVGWNVKIEQEQGRRQQTTRAAVRPTISGTWS